MTTTPPLRLETFAHWLAAGERGISSEAIVSHLTGVTVGRYRSTGDHPYDPSDFRRCERLLRQVPIARLTFHSMREVSPTWAALVDAWDELVALLEEEAPGAIDDPQPRGGAPRTYQRMREIRQAASA